jgi:MoxR-like ATPase
VTIDGTSRPLPRPFLVVATQNPFDLHGTFQLPDSQLDRFLMRLSLGYPDRATERAILKHARRPIPDTVMNPGQLEQLAGRAMSAQVPELVEEYLLDLVVATRSDARFVRGVSTRGAQALHRAVRARAFLAGRRYAVPEDVRDLAVPVLAHRVLVRSVGLEGDGGILAVRALLDELPRPL